MSKISYSDVLEKLKANRSEISEACDDAVVELGVFLSKFDGSTASGISLPALFVLCQRFCEVYSAETAILNRICGVSDLVNTFSKK